MFILGANGFLGSNLQNELASRNISYLTSDIDDIDLSLESSILLLVTRLEKIDNVVLLASTIGAKLFETDPVNSAKINEQIFRNVIQAINIASKKYSKSYSVIYYSTSEVFWTLPSINTVITENTQYKFDFSNPRHLYALVKYKAECTLFNLKMYHPEIINLVKIIRPFNIYGRNQTRGVLYDMIHSALTENKIYFSDDTTRTMTDIDFASKMSVDAILSTLDLKINVADPRNSLTMEALANIVNDVLNLKCHIIKTLPDHSVRYRTVSKVNENIPLSKNIMAPHILELAEQIKQTL